MDKNIIKPVRNPNSPEAIQARLDGYTDTTPYEQVKYIFDPKASHIFVDLTTHQVDQAINYPLFEISQKFDRSLVRSSLSYDKNRQLIMTNYYTDARNSQWVIVKSFFNKSIPGLKSTTTPQGSTLNSFHGGYFASARGEVWRNEGKSVDKLRESQKRIYDTTKIAANSNNEIDIPSDEYKSDEV